MVQYFTTFGIGAAPARGIVADLLQRPPSAYKAGPLFSFDGKHVICVTIVSLLKIEFRLVFDIIFIYEAIVINVQG